MLSLLSSASLLLSNKLAGWEVVVDNENVKLMLLFVGYCNRRSRFLQDSCANNAQPGERTARTVSRTSEQTKTATDQHFYYVSIPEWDNLSDQARNAASVDSFKSFLTSNINFEKLLSISHYYDWCP